MSSMDISSLRATFDSLEKEGELIRITGEVDPIYEVSGIQMSLENGPAVIFDNIKGYPGVCDLGNYFSRRERVARVFGLDDHKKIKHKIREAMKNPLPARYVEEAPCQEVVIAENIDVPGTIPLLKHTEKDAGRILGGGIIMIAGDYFGGGSQLSFNRMNFRGKDWSSIQAPYGTHSGESFLAHRGEKVPITINIGTPPAVTVIGGGSVMHTVIPTGTDKLAIAGALQGFPVNVVKAKTVDAPAIAESEWVIEGYVDTTQRVWETDEAEKIQKHSKAPFFPEWPGYMGRAWKNFKFQATAITHRKDRPVFYSPLAHSFEGDILCSLLREACFFELAERFAPGLVADVNILSAITPRAGVIFQVKKRRPADEGYQKNLINVAFGSTQGLYLVVVVDEDIDIYSADDVLWAITTRVNAEHGIIKGVAGARGSPMLPIERIGLTGQEIAASAYGGGIGIDATIPFGSKAEFERGLYPVWRVDLNKWLSKDVIERIRAAQSDYARVFSRRGG